MSYYIYKCARAINYSLIIIAHTSCDSVSGSIMQTGSGNVNLQTPQFTLAKVEV